MRLLKQLFFSFLLIALGSNFALASHVSGGNITYVYTGVPNTYQVTLSLYRDCSGISAPSQGGSGNPFVTFESDCGDNLLVEFPNILLQEISAVDTTYCPDGTTCGGGNLPGMQLLQYQATVVMPPCSEWTMSYSLSARNTSVNTNGGNFYIETTLDNTVSNTNTSPSLQWTPTNGFDPIPYGCVGSLKTYALNVVEPDGDSLAFSLVSGLTAGGTNIGYTGTYSATSPIGGITIDPVTGLLTFTATAAGNYVVTIMIEEYDGNGNLIGTVLHDFQFVAEICVNNAPVAPNQVVNYNNINTNANLDTTNNTISMCAGDQFCFDLTFTDPDGDSIALSSNVEDILPNATFSFVYVSPDTVIGTVCWAYQAGYTGTIINVTANELICIPGSATFSIALDIPPPLNVSQDLDICGIQTADLSATGQGPLTWSVISGDPIVIGTNFSCNPCNTPVATPAFTTTYLVSDNSVCNLTDTVVVSVADNFGGLGVGINTPDTTICLWDCVDVDAYTEEAFYGMNSYPWVVTPQGLNGQINPNSSLDVGLPTAAIGGLTTVTNGTVCEVCFKITHPQASDLKIELKAPNGALFLLSDGNGGTGNAFGAGTGMTCFNMDNINPIVGSAPPFVNANGYLPQGGNLGTAGIGANVGGIWKLKVTNSGNSTAIVNRWSIKFCDPYVNWYNSSFFAWDNQDGMPATPAVSPTVCPQVGGQYVLTAYTVDYCFVNDTININLHPQPDAGNDTTVKVCLETGMIDLFTYLGGTPDSVGTWQDVNGVPVNPVMNSNAVLDSLPYLYIAESPNGCLDSAYLIVDIIEVTVDDTALVHATCKDFCDGEITITATNALSYQVVGLNTGPQPVQNTNVFTGLCDDIYTVTAFNQPNGQFCVANMTNVVITEPDLLKITNFSVNNTGENTNPDLATLANPLAVKSCEEKSVPLSGVPEGGNENGFYQFEWYMNNSYIGTGQNWTTPNNTAGPGYVILNDGFCPADTAFFNMQHYVPIEPLFTKTDDGCAPLLVTFTDASTGNFLDNGYNNVKFSFSNGGALIVNDQSSGEYTFVEAGTYEITMAITSVNSCNYEKTFISQADQVIAFDKPRLKFNVNPEQVSVYEPTATIINLSPSGGADDATNFNWEFPKGEPATSDAINPSVTYPEPTPGKYPIKLTAENIHGCVSELNGEVNIINDVNIFAPNIFTPDGNQFNQTWRVYINGIDIYDYELVIYNRYGEVVFQSFDSEASWDGRYGNNGNIVQDGTYAWVVTAKDAIDDNKYEFKGTINVVK
jgi:gliding motility-associated-like protein